MSTIRKEIVTILMLTLPAMSCNETIAKNIIAAYDITRGIVNHRALSPPPH